MEQDRTFPAWVGVGLLLLSSAFSRPAPAETISAVVVEVSGDWVLEGPGGETVVEVGQGLAGGAVLRAKPPADESKIALGLMRGKSSGSTLLHSCAAGACKTRIEVPAGEAPRTLAERFLAATYRLLAGHPDRFAVLAGRGNSSGSLLTFGESVLASQGDVLAATPPLPASSRTRGTTHEDLRFRLRPIDEDGRLAPLETAIEVDLDAGGGPAVFRPRTPVAPGLYDIGAGADVRATGVTGGDGVWVLVATPSNSSDFRRDYGSAVALTAAWRPQVSETAIRRHLRAYLVHLLHQQQQGATY